jgi:hypothetical protein
LETFNRCDLAIGFQPGDIISYTEMCSTVGASLQRGMNFRLQGNLSVILMSLRPGAPYADRVEEDGHVLIYEGHDCPKTATEPYPKQLDQPEFNPGGSCTQNGLFAEAARRHRDHNSPPELVRVFEKIRPGIWAYNGTFELIDYWTETSGNRRVFKFKLRLTEREDQHRPSAVQFDDEDDRIIPSAVKLEVWKRDQGRCRKCGLSQGLHFDHIIPYSKGGSSKDPANIQILCGRHNLEKRDRIE